MLTDSYCKHWLQQLDERAAVVDAGASLYLLIDGVFMPGFHRLVSRTLAAPQAVTMLFESLPGWDDETRGVSPFLLRYDPSNERLKERLRECSGWPMLCAIVTSEAQAALTARLAAWCVIKVGAQRFNFRFPDTRRLPKIFATLTSTQREQFTGLASRFSYIGRNGEWQELAVTAAHVDLADRPALDDQQFAALVADSEADEVLLMLRRRSITTFQRHSEAHELVSSALRAAMTASLSQDRKLDWCASRIASGVVSDAAPTRVILDGWLRANP